MRWEWVNLDARTVTIPAEVMKNKDGTVIPLNGLAYAVLQRQLGQDNEYVFVYNGKPVKSVSTPTWYRVLKHAGIKIGNRWRFDPSVIERLVTNRAADGPAREYDEEVVQFRLPRGRQ
jgi:integrase